MTFQEQILRPFEKLLWLLGLLPFQFEKKLNCYVMSTHFKLIIVIKHIYLTILGLFVLADVVLSKERVLAFISTVDQFNLTAILRLLFRLVWFIHEFVMLFCIYGRKYQFKRAITDIFKITLKSEISSDFQRKFLCCTWLLLLLIATHFVTRLYEFGFSIHNIIQCIFLDTHLVLLSAFCLYLKIILSSVTACFEQKQNSLCTTFKYHDLWERCDELFKTIGPVIIIQHLLLFITFLVDIYYEYHLLVLKDVSGEKNFIALAVSACQSSEAPLVFLFSIYFLIEHVNKKVS